MNIIITGADSGIGKQLALDYQNLGHHVIATHYEVGHDYHLDLSNLDSIKACCQQIKKLNLKIDLVINNAGISCWGPQLEIDDAVWENVIKVNLIGTRHFIKYSLPLLSEKAKIVTITSSSRFVMMPFMGSYPLTKMALYGCHLLLKREFLFSKKYKNLQISCLDLGSYNTPMWEKAGTPHFDKTTELGKLCWNFGEQVRVQEIKKSGTIEDASNRIIKTCSKNKLKSYYFFGPTALVMYILGLLPNSLFTIFIKLRTMALKPE